MSDTALAFYFISVVSKWLGYIIYCYLCILSVPLPRRFEFTPGYIMDMASTLLCTVDSLTRFLPYRFGLMLSSRSKWQLFMTYLYTSLSGFSRIYVALKCYILTICKYLLNANLRGLTMLTLCGRCGLVGLNNNVTNKVKCGLLKKGFFTGIK